VEQLGKALEEAQRHVDSQSDDVDKLRQAEEELTQAAHAMAEELYRATGAPGEQQGGEPGVVDADFEEHPPHA
jgi:hypothetical protein